MGKDGVFDLVLLYICTSAVVVVFFLREIFEDFVISL